MPLPAMASNFAVSHSCKDHIYQTFKNCPNFSLQFHKSLKCPKHPNNIRSTAYPIRKLYEIPESGVYWFHL